MSLIKFKKRRTGSSVIKAGHYEDLPRHLQRAIDSVEASCKKPIGKASPKSTSNLEKRIRNILQGK